MAKTCIRVEACNIGSSERHNLRSKELDYIRPELTHRNEQWVECSIAEVHRDITEKYKEATGQGLQKKATPIREGVIVISEETTIQQLQDLAEKLEERFGVHAFQIYTHKDEGANVWDGKEEAWKPNYHAHMIFDWTDGHTGKTVKLNRHDMAEMQTITAECLNMERGVSSDKKHLSAMQYKNKMETEKAEQLQKDIEQLNRAYTAGTEKITTVQKELSTAQKELNSMKTDIHINEAKEAAAKAGKTGEGAGAFFFQERPGKGGKIFRVIKFKTMTDECDADGQLLPDADRLTKVGRFVRSISIDELPQLINVLKGDMALIGPRPLLPQYLPLYSKEQARRHEVRPGITGWAQVNGRNAISWTKKFELDVWYVDHISFFLDLKIIFLTMRKVFMRDGINSENDATMEDFNGNN